MRFQAENAAFCPKIHLSCPVEKKLVSAPNPRGFASLDSKVQGGPIDSVGCRTECLEFCATGPLADFLGLAWHINIISLCRLNRSDNFGQPALLLHQHRDKRLTLTVSSQEKTGLASFIIEARAKVRANDVRFSRLLTFAWSTPVLISLFVASINGFGTRT